VDEYSDGKCQNPVHRTLAESTSLTCSRRPISARCKSLGGIPPDESSNDQPVHAGIFHYRSKETRKAQQAKDHFALDTETNLGAGLIVTPRPRSCIRQNSNDSVPRTTHLSKREVVSFLSQMYQIHTYSKLINT